MLRSRFALQSFAAIGLLLNTHPGRADTGDPTGQGVGVAIEDFTYVDTSGEPTDQTEAHRKELAAFMHALRGDFEADGRYHLVPVSCGSSCEDDWPAGLVRAARQGGASLVVIGGVHKQSTLVQWAKVQVVDIDAGRVVLDRLFTFRGDNSQAWDRAEVFVSREIRTALIAPAEPTAAVPPSTAAAGAASAPPIKLAMFDFELQDFSAAAPDTSIAPADAAQLEHVTEDVRQLLANSGRFSLIDINGTDVDAIKGHTLHDCSGCEAGIARKLGADQSFLGIVSRISRTEYTVKFQVRNAITGEVVCTGDSGLRMGADYSWSRGATRLVGDRLLDGAASTTDASSGKLPSGANSQ